MKVICFPVNILENINSTTTNDVWCQIIGAFLLQATIDNNNVKGCTIQTAFSSTHPFASEHPAQIILSMTQSGFSSQDNPGEDAAVLLVTYESADGTKVTPQLFLSPRVERYVVTSQMIPC